MTTLQTVSSLSQLLSNLDSGFQTELNGYLNALNIRYDYGSWSTAFTVSSGTSLVKYVNDRGQTRDTLSSGFTAVRVTNTTDASANFRVRTATPREAPEIVAIKHKLRKDLIARVTTAHQRAKGDRVSRS